MIFVIVFYSIIRMPHWSYKEMHDAFGWDLNQYVYFGGYPGSAAFVSDERRWRRYITDSIIAPSIEKDVIKTSVIYKPALMHNLFELGCAYSGKELSLNKMLGQLQDVGNVTTLSNYLNLLDESHLLGALTRLANIIAFRSCKFIIQRYSRFGADSLMSRLSLMQTSGEGGLKLLSECS